MDPGDLLLPRIPNDPTYHTTSGIILRIGDDPGNPLLQILWCDGVVTRITLKRVLTSWRIYKTPPRGV